MIEVNYPPTVATASPGTASAPGYAFLTAASDGMYLVAAGTVGFATVGTQRATLAAGGLKLFTGQFEAPDGTAGAPSLAFFNSLATGLYRIGADLLGVATAGTERLRIDSSGRVGVGGAAGASALFQVTSTTLGALPAPTLTTTQRNAVATPANGLLVFNATTNQYEFNAGSSGAPSWAAVGAGSGATILAADGTAGAPGLSFSTQSAMGLYKLGTNILGLATAGVGRWQVDASGHLLAVTDNSFDIGASGATRPRNLFVAGAATIGGATQVGGTLTAAAMLAHTGSSAGFFNTAPVAKQTGVSASTIAGIADGFTASAIQTLQTALANLGLITSPA